MRYLLRLMLVIVLAVFIMGNSLFATNGNGEETKYNKEKLLEYFYKDMINKQIRIANYNGEIIEGKLEKIEVNMLVIRKRNKQRRVAVNDIENIELLPFDQQKSSFNKTIGIAVATATGVILALLLNI